jgi:hypothetical protein
MRGNTEGAINKNGQSRETGKIWYKQDKTKTHHYRKAVETEAQQIILT